MESWFKYSIGITVYDKDGVGMDTEMLEVIAKTPNAAIRLALRNTRRTWGKDFTYVLESFTTKDSNVNVAT